MTTDQQREREIQAINQGFDRLYQARLREERNLTSLFTDEREQQLFNTLEGEIHATGVATRDALRRMSDSFDRAMTAVANAARAWEDKAISS